MKDQKVVLISVVGMSPAILTETIWALYTEKADFLPDEVKVYTTRTAWNNIQNTLLPDVWEELQQKTGKNMVLKKHIFENHQGGELEDIVTNEDQELVADQLLRGIREYKNPQQEVCRLVASVAGGRKSMSALMYATMSLGAEPGDIITHVLADAHASNCREFFFPEQSQQQLIATINGKKENFTAADTKLDLAEIPFVPLSVLVKNTDFDTNGSFNKLVQRAQRTIAEISPAQPEIRISKTKCQIQINGVTITLEPEEYTLMAIIAQHGIEKAHQSPRPLLTINEAKETYLKLRNGALPEAVTLKMSKRQNFFKDMETLGDVWPNSISKPKSNLKKVLESNGFPGVADDCLGNLRNGEMCFKRITDIKFID